ncbi:MAG: 16S rRNA (uracil(1498)-N(3))-methyltransferase [Paenisporosarcina sp.]
MQRYFSSHPFVNNQLLISGDDAKHIQKVMRMHEGEFVIIVTDEIAYKAVIIGFEGQDVRLVMNEGPLKSNELPKKIRICCGLPKGEKLDFITQKGTELGMHELVLFEAERSIVKWDASKGLKKQQRLQKIAKEAAEQSHRNKIPQVSDMLSFKQLLSLSSQYDLLFVADEEEAKETNRQRFVDQLKESLEFDSLLVVFGPEGGLSRKEISELHEKGFHSISLGPRILRAETAPLYVLSAISYELE